MDGKMEHEMEIGRIWGLKELKLSYHKVCTYIYICNKDRVYPIRYLKFSSLTTSQSSLCVK